jgi:hypothetical protein
MKLISRRIKMNPDTFAPEMEIVLTLPMELAMDVLVHPTMTEVEYQKNLEKNCLS